jgi:hypothetical protein
VIRTSNISTPMLDSSPSMRVYRSKGRGRTGAVLHLPYEAYSHDFIGSASPRIREYLNDDNNAKRFFDFAKNFAKRRFPKTNIKDVILVTGYSVATSWAAAVFLDKNVRAQLASQELPKDQVDLQWRVENDICQHVQHHTSIPSQVRCLGPRQPDKY